MVAVEVGGGRRRWKKRNERKICAGQKLGLIEDHSINPATSLIAVALAAVAGGRHFGLLRRRFGLVVGARINVISRPDAIFVVARSDVGTQLRPEVQSKFRKSSIHQFPVSDRNDARLYGRRCFISGRG